MRIGLLTSWRVPCGVYQYSARFADALAANGETPVILAGRADEHRSVPEESSHEVHDVGGIGLWRDDGQSWLDVDRIGDLNLDVVHVQYQNMLLQQSDIERLRYAYKGLLAGTFHDNCVAPSFPAYAFDLLYSHREGVGTHARPVTFPVEDRPPLVRTFGLGRSRADLIGPVCEKNGWLFETAASHEPIHGGGQAWQTHAELIAWLRGADAVALWYDDNGMAGSSQAARTAMAARRPVVTNSTTWFSDLPEETPGYKKVDTLDELETWLRDTFYRPYQALNSWRTVAGAFVADYAAELQALEGPRAA